MILSVKDLVGYALTGEAVTDRTDMSGSGFMNLETGNYDPSLTALFGIGEMNACLPEIRSPFDIRGYVTPETARVTGLDAGTPVSCGMFDIDACALSAGTGDPGDICMIAGTWSINEYISPAPVLHGVAMNSLYCVDGLYLAEESSAAIPPEILSGCAAFSGNTATGSLTLLSPALTRRIAECISCRFSMPQTLRLMQKPASSGLTPATPMPT